MTIDSDIKIDEKIKQKNVKQKKIIINLVKLFASKPDYLIKELFFFYSKFAIG